MGHKITYCCTKCDYHYCGSAGLDYGMFAVVDTFLCLNCRQLSDVQIGEFGIINYHLLFPITQKEIKTAYKKLRCEECNSDNIILWDSKNKPCPVAGCKGTLTEDPNGIQMLWD